MILYIALIAALNLCVGYFLGVYIGILPGIAGMPRTINASTLCPAGTAVVSTPESTNRTVPKPEFPHQELNELSLEHTIQKQEFIAPRDNTIAKHQVAGETPELTEIQKELPPINEQQERVEGGNVEANQSEHVDMADFMNGLAIFQTHLSEIDQELQQQEPDAKSLGECAGHLQDASEQYMDQVKNVSKELVPAESDSKELAEEKLLLKQKLMDQAEQVEEQKFQLGIVEIAEDTLGAKKTLQSASTDLSEAARTLEEQLGEIFSSINHPETSLPQEPEAERTNKSVPEGSTRHANWITKDEANRLIKEYLKHKSGAEDNFVTALIELDANEDRSMEFSERLLEGVSQIVDAEIKEQHTATKHAETRLKLLLRGESIDSATVYLERVRQEVAASKFLANGKSLSATVSCALANAALASDAKSLEDNLEEAIRESRRFGANRTFTHDGISAEPIVPPELEVAMEERVV